MHLAFLSLNCENMADLVPSDGSPPANHLERRSRLLAALVASIDPDIIAMVEAAPTAQRTQRWVDEQLDGDWIVHQGERRGILGLAIAVRSSLDLTVTVRSKEECEKLYEIGHFDADGDGIREVYSWANRVPLEAVVSGEGLAAPVTVIVIHAKSKGVFIPGDLHAYEKQAQATRMKLRAQGRAVRRRLEQLVNEQGGGRVVVLGDMNDSAEFDIYAARLGGAFLDRVIGSIWDPMRIFSDPHHAIDLKDRWTMDYKDRVVNPLAESRYGMPTDLRSWIDHILVSPELRSTIVSGTAVIHHGQPLATGMPAGGKRIRGTDHHPPSVTLDL